VPSQNRVDFYKERCSFEKRSVREAATSAARDLGYPNLKPAVKAVEAFMKGHVFCCTTNGI